MKLSPESSDGAYSSLPKGHDTSIRVLSSLGSQTPVKAGSYERRFVRGSPSREILLLWPTVFPPSDCVILRTPLPPHLRRSPRSDFGGWRAHNASPRCAPPSPSAHKPFLMEMSFLERS